MVLPAHQDGDAGLLGPGWRPTALQSAHAHQVRLEAGPVIYECRSSRRTPEAIVSGLPVGPEGLGRGEWTGWGMEGELGAQPRRHRGPRGVQTNGPGLRREAGPQQIGFEFLVLGARNSYVETRGAGASGFLAGPSREDGDLPGPGCQRTSRRQEQWMWPACHRQIRPARGQDSQRWGRSAGERALTAPPRLAIATRPTDEAA
ncbi:hypothetical protein ACCO45_003720 [Purpureocillium lilacinum]|uniref:Uncharacterized protein n=1 Tax=Purpureocillium lilacinum TaxID=33203 RepID=A0ACC4E0R4_PURLI